MARAVNYTFDLSQQTAPVARTWADFLHGQRRSFENMARDQQAMRMEISVLESKNLELEGAILALESELKAVQMGAVQQDAGPSIYSEPPQLLHLPAQQLEPRHPPPQQLPPQQLPPQQPVPAPVPMLLEPEAPARLDPVDRMQPSLQPPQSLSSYQPGGWPAQPYTAETSGRDHFRFAKALTDHAAPVHGVAINAETTLLATASWDSTVKLYDLQSQEVIRTMGSEESEKMSGLYSIAFSKTQAEILGCTSADYNVYLWNYNTGALQCALRGHENEVNGIDFHSTQQVVATASDDHKCIVWDMEQREALRVLDQHTKPVYGCVFMGMENQYLVATCCFDLNTRIFDMRSSDVVACIQTHADDITGIDYSSGKQLLATGSDDGKISIVDARQRRLLQQLDTREVLPENEVKRLAFSQCGNLLAASCSTGKVLVYSVNESSAKQVAVLGGHADCIFDVAWGVTDDGSKLLASASHDHTVGLWKEVL